MYLYAYHYLLVDENENYQLLRKITDHTSVCFFANKTDFILESLELTDINRDSIGEISFLYTLGCLSNVSPIPLKLFLLTQGKKYAIRGTTKEQIEVKNDLKFKGGEYEIGKELELEPPFKRFLQNKWLNYINPK